MSKAVTTPMKLPLKQLLKLMEPEHRRVSESILEEYGGQLCTLPGSMHKHQVWEGGLLSHIEEAMNIAKLLYESLCMARPLDFTLDEALFSVFIHDFDKLLRYQVKPDDNAAEGKYAKGYKQRITELLAQQYHYELTDAELNALEYAHGENEDYNPMNRIMLPLATLVHCADVISARIWYDYGRSHDSWED